MTRSELRFQQDQERHHQRQSALLIVIIALLIALIMCVTSSHATVKTSDLMSRAVLKAETGYNEKIYLGTFSTTGYCNCRTCCGKWAGGPTASGAMPKASHTIAVDPDIIPLGSRVLIDGIIYTAEDTGGKWVQGNHIDIYYDDHQMAKDHGTKKADVWLLK
jgi:3D (Asp-Asp-Asp) domain-containing protein